MTTKNRITMRPMIAPAFSIPLFKARNKTQLRIPVTPQPPPWVTDPITSFTKSGATAWGQANYRAVFKHGNIGDILWMQEEWATSIHWDTRNINLAETPGNGYGWPVWYTDGTTNLRGRKDLDGGPAFCNMGVWRPAKTMPKWASRAVVTITDIQVECLQVITEEDAAKEGCHPTCFTWISGGQDTCKNVFRNLWNYNHWQDKFKWESSPFVWVVTLKL